MLYLYGSELYCYFVQMCVIKILYFGTNTVFTTAAIARGWPKCQSISVALDDFFFFCASSFHQVCIFCILLFFVRFQFLLIIFALDAVVLYSFSLHCANNNFLLPQACLQRNRRWLAFVQVCFFIDYMNYLKWCMALLSEQQSRWACLSTDCFWQ